MLLAKKTYSHSISNPLTFRYVNQIRDLVNRGAPVNGIGVQGHLGGSIDLGKVETAFDKLWSNFKFPIW
jgi:GH35 family endo-1,4-beta-xylanase